MNKKLITLAVAGALAAPTAFADAEVYGKIRGSVDFVTNNAEYVSGSKRDDSKMSVSNQTSRIGFKGSEDLGGGLSAIFQWENAVDLDTGDGWEGARNTYIGLAGDWGQVRIGRHDSPYKMSTGRLDPFSDTLGDYNAIIGKTLNLSSTTPVNLGDNRIDNVIAYVSPNMNGFNFAAAFSPDFVDDDLPDQTDAENAAISLSVAYDNGPFYVTLAFEQLGEAGNTKLNATEAEDTQALKLGGSWTFNNDNTMIGGIFEALDLGEAANTAGTGNADMDRDAFYLMGTHKMGANTLKLTVGGADEIGDFSDTGATFFALGIAHALSENTEVYALYSMVSNDKNAGYELSGSGVSLERDTSQLNANADIGQDIGAFSLGVNHNFSTK